MARYALFLVLGAMLSLLTLGTNMIRNATDAYANYILYAARTNAHSIATSAANITANWIFLDTLGNNISYSNISFNGGTFNASSVDDYSRGRKIITATSEVKTYLPGYIVKPYTGDTTGFVRDTCIVILQPSGYCKYAYYSVLEGSINWASADTIWGPFHTQDIITYKGSPTFYGKVTTNKGKTGSSGTPNFFGGYQSGINVPLNPKSLTILKQAALDSGRYFRKDSLRLVFKGDSIKWKFGTKPDTTKLIKDFTRCGVIYLDSNIIYVSGTNHGRITVASVSSTAYMGKIYIEDDIKYTDDPRVVIGAKNITGLVASNEIYISTSIPNDSDVVIQAAMFSLNQGFGADSYDKKKISGTIYLFGGITQKQCLAVGTLNSGNGKIEHGYAKNYKYDTRLFSDAPPFFPTTGRYEIISWRE